MMNVDVVDVVGREPVGEAGSDPGVKESASAAKARFGAACDSRKEVAEFATSPKQREQSPKSDLRAKRPKV